MSPLPVVPRARARDDIDAAVDYYREAGSPEAGLRFVDALQQASETIGDHPGIGSLRYADELDLPGLRTWPVPGYPFLVFYVERPDHVDVWRVLHGRRDLPATFQNGQ